MKNTHSKSFAFTSQYSPTISKDWQWRSCGVACVKILMDFWHAEDEKNKTASLKEILNAATKVGAYIPKIGWSHKGLVNTAKIFGYDGYNRDLADKPQELAFKALEEEVSIRPAIASVKSRFDPDAKDGHLVVVTRIDKKSVHVIDPEEKYLGAATKAIPINKFLTAYKKRIILIRPQINNKLDRILNSKINLFESYISMIKGSVGTNMFRHLYLKVDGKNVDILENGNVSCSSYMSNLLYLWGLIKDSHAKTEHTIKDMEESGWYKIKTPKVGCVIQWENAFAKRMYPHIGFYIGDDKAVSTDSEKTGHPVIHHYTYGKINGKPKRKIIAFYWHKALGE